jgi:amino acid adenylation domain-containing protein
MPKVSSNPTDKRSTELRNIISGFLESSERFASRPALVVDGQSLTYLDLRRKTGKIASLLQRTEEGNSPLVAILAYRSATAYAGILGALAAGKGYVPLNPKFPAERTRRMLILSGCSQVIVGKECVANLRELLQGFQQSLTVILPETADATDLQMDFPLHRYLSSKDISGDRGSAFETAVSAQAIAYLLFTSGTTGEPKGVPITHSNVQSYIDYMCSQSDLNETDRFSQHSDLTFDLSVHDIFVAWERGACLYCLPERAVLLPAKFIRDNALTSWFSVPSIIGVLSKMRLLETDFFPSLRCSFFCGEPLPTSYAQLWQNAAPHSIVENLYGPTEATIAISHYRWDRNHSPGECLNGICPIGWTFARQRSSIADQDFNILPKNQTGELFLAGSQVTSGYWNDPEKTGAKFVRLGASEDTTWYRTGDLVKQDWTGCMYYLGRIDDQVKIRGYRAELQEIEAVLRKACGTDQVVSVAWPVRDGSADGVVAFVSSQKALDEGKALKYCRTYLPGYMVPQRIYALDALPLNVNGKVDRRGLVRLLEGART